MNQTPFLSIENLSKSFGSTQALDAVSLKIEKGKIFGLAGENGAGKSTLIKILCGVHVPDTGKMFLEGEPHHPRDPETAERLGISVFHQEIPVCPNLSIAANVFLGPAMPKKGLSPDWRLMNERCSELYRNLLGEEIDPTQLIRNCKAAEKQLALLVRVLSRNARLIILDEPTTALTPPEVARMFSIIKRLKDQGITFIFISHMLEELMELSDTITVLRDGKSVGTLIDSEFDRKTLSEMIAGRTLTSRSAKAVSRETETYLEVKNLSLDQQFQEVSFKLRKGQILGIAGLQGSGRSELVRVLFGAPPASSGQIIINGNNCSILEPRDAIRAGVGYIPEDRNRLGIFDDMDVKLNLCMAGIDRFSRHGFIHKGNLRQVANRMQDDVAIKMESVDAPIISLSGGNQQKVLISRWLALRPNILIMNEPTRGVDVGAKHEITELIIRLAEEGYTFVISSSELEELIQISDLILVMNRGRVAKKFTGGEATKDQLILAATT